MLNNGYARHKQRLVNNDNKLNYVRLKMAVIEITAGLVLGAFNGGHCLSYEQQGFL
jgi:hypothetical protein